MGFAVGPACYTNLTDACAGMLTVLGERGVIPNANNVTTVQPPQSCFFTKVAVLGKLARQQGTVFLPSCSPGISSDLSVDLLLFAAVFGAVGIAGGLRFVRRLWGSM